ncbi:MAG TPA: hypothetical protein PLA44_14540, partial [Propionibacteriaceae bacterium]|nr:hypothetical protein [Propionibacteriaceae bacterium]
MSRILRTRQPRSVQRYTIDEWLMDASRLGLDRPVTTWGASNTESIGNSFEGYVQQGYKTNGVIFAVILARMLLFTEARFQFQQLDKGRPGNLFG